MALPTYLLIRPSWVDTSIEEDVLTLKTECLQQVISGYLTGRFPGRLMMIQESACLLHGPDGLLSPWDDIHKDDVHGSRLAEEQRFASHRQGFSRSNYGSLPSLVTSSSRDDGTE